MNHIKEGAVLVITSGSYSDYWIRDFLRVTRSFEQDDVVERFKASGRHLVYSEVFGEGVPEGSHERFLAYLIDEGLAETVAPDAVLELYLGNDWNLDPRIKR